MRVYIAHRYSCKGNVLDVLHSIGKAVQIGTEVASLGDHPFVPHLDWLICSMDGALGATIPKEYYYESSMDFLSVCDCMLVVDSEDIRYSRGVAAEFDFCEAHGIPVFVGLREYKNFLVQCEAERHA